ncbi:MAG: hypothetical protein ACRDLE_10040 [Gaiellaceae bacterium]
MSVPLGLLAAALASGLYNVGLLLQAVASRRGASRSAPRSRPAWSDASSCGVGGSPVGTGVSGWPLQAFALTRAPLTVVQPVLGVGLVVPLIFGAPMLGDRVRRRDMLNVAALIAGVSLLVAVAPPRKIDTTIDARLVIALTALAVLIVAFLFLTVVLPGRRGSLLIAAAGIGFALSSMTTKLLADAATRHRWVLAAVWLAVTVISAAAALIGEMNALQIRSAGAVSSLVFALETVVPVGLSPLLFGETGNAGSGSLALRACGLALAIAAAVALTRAPVVEHALAEE